MTILATYGTTTVCRSVGSDKPSFAAVCSACVETIKVSKQHARAASAARGHAVDVHGFRFDWSNDVEQDVWYHDLSDGRYVNVWESAAGDWYWLLGRTGHATTRTGRIAGGRAASRVSAQLLADLAAGDKR